MERGSEMRQFAAMDEEKMKASFVVCESVYNRSPTPLEIERAWTIYKRVLEREG